MLRFLQNNIGNHPQGVSTPLTHVTSPNDPLINLLVPEQQAEYRKQLKDNRPLVKRILKERLSVKKVQESSCSREFMIKRKLWVALAHDQLKGRKRFLGAEFAKPCQTCGKILMCDGPIGLHFCTTVNQMIDDGLLKGPKRIQIDKRRAKFLPISRDCLIAYGLLAKPNHDGNNAEKGNISEQSS
jgi:hypothetical protein